MRSLGQSCELTHVVLLGQLQDLPERVYRILASDGITLKVADVVVRCKHDAYSVVPFYRVKSNTYPRQQVCDASIDVHARLVTYDHCGWWAGAASSLCLMHRPWCVFVGLRRLEKRLMVLETRIINRVPQREVDASVSFAPTFRQVK